jgi:glycosyltransferase involved in cell wall biosynthesis
MKAMKLISVVTPCYNEEGNVQELHARIAQVLEAWIAARGDAGKWDWEHLFIDNCSQDSTPQVLRALAQASPRVKVILNNRNFGHIRSPYHGMLQASGDVVIVMASDLQDPPELMPEFLERWEKGWKIVVGQKTTSEESPLFFALRGAYYRLVKGLAEVELIEHVTGFGLYDRQVIEQFRALNEPYPYVRGLISELGFPVAKVAYAQPLRRRGVSKNNFYTLYDMAMLGITSHSKVPLRLATMMGFALSMLSFLAGCGYLLYKLLFWSRFDAGVAPLVIGLFFIGSVQLFFIGIVGEYVGFIHTQVLQRPHVTERERINFDAPAVPQVLAPEPPPTSSQHDEQKAPLAL